MQADHGPGVYNVPDNLEKLLILPFGDIPSLSDKICAAIKADSVVLVRGASASAADSLVASVAEQLGLRSQLELQSTFASILGHRQNVGKYFMTVNKRSDYQIVSSHSEGDAKGGMQLASFYCFENTTDGGESILQHVRADSPAWNQLRGLEKRVDLGGRVLSRREISIAKMRHQLDIPADILDDSVTILAELEEPIPGIKLYDVLAKPRKLFSTILNRDVSVYWDNIASADFDNGAECLKMLRSTGLLKEAPGGLDIHAADSVLRSRKWSSGVKYEALFDYKVVHKLQANDLLIQNNLTWTHATNNWTPGSGVRKVVAAFA